MPPRRNPLRPPTGGGGPGAARSLTPRPIFPSPASPRSAPPSTSPSPIVRPALFKGGSPLINRLGREWSLALAKKMLPPDGSQQPGDIKLIRLLSLLPQSPRDLQAAQGIWWTSAREALAPPAAQRDPSSCARARGGRIAQAPLQPKRRLSSSRLRLIH